MRIAARFSLLLLIVIPTMVSGWANAAEPPITVYQPGGITDEVLAATAAAAGEAGGVWTPIHDGTLELTAVYRGDTAIQQARPGYRYPMSTRALDAAAARALLGPDIAAALEAGTVVFGATSAALRGADVGDSIEFIGWDRAAHRFDIGLIVPDERIWWAELVFSTEAAATFGFERIGSLRVWDHGVRDTFEIGLHRLAPDAPIRVTTADDPRNPDWVLPTVLIKHQFGEYSYRPRSGTDSVTMEDAWYDANIVLVDAPVVGRFRCHRLLEPLLVGAFKEIEAAGLDGLISRSNFQRAGGCYNPRRIRGGDKGGSMSRHAWGAAIDFNTHRNPYGGPANMDPQIVEIFRRWGFAWGGGWIFTDGGHFEWIQPPLQGPPRWAPAA